ncbi:MAG: fibronectin type III domain-containing protein, partial [Saprospiraceae bacterium]
MKYYIGLIFLMMNLGLTAQLRCVATSNPTGAYAVVTSSGLDYESPECVHGSFGPHITQAFDSLLNRYVFLFHSHIDDDNDRCLNFDRVRMEIKGGPNTSPESQHLLNTTSYYRWKFKIPADFKGSSSFCHIFQNKIFGGNDTDFPVITLTPRESVLEIIHNGGDSGLPLGKLATVNLSLLRGRWIEAYIKQFHAEVGKIEIELKDVISKQVILTYKNDNIDLWRAGAEYSRPKWGIYRAKGASLKDEIIQLADFCISESAESLCPSENVVIADNIKPTTPANLIITDKSRYTIDLSWNASTDNLGVTQYNITRNGQMIKSLNALNYKDTGLLPGTIYTYTITAQDAAGNLSSSSNSVVSSTDAANVKPGIPVLVSPV